MAAPQAPQLIVIAGPTAAGKSALAQQIALARDGEVLNFDSQQFYKDISIGTGKVLPKDQQVPHWFLDAVAPGKNMSAMDFVRMARPVIDRLHQKNKLPILVGGTGLYLRALLEGFDPLPPRHPQIRTRLEARLKEVGPATLHQELQKIDPKRAAQIMPQDGQRLVRALEIFEITGKPPSKLLQRGRATRLHYISETHWLSPPRALLWERIAARVRQMFVDGWMEEVRGLMAQGQDPRHWSHRPLGYAEIAEAIAQGQGESEELIEKIVLKTRQYAKRQETFFKGLFLSEAYQKEGSSLIVLRDVR